MQKSIAVPEPSDDLIHRAALVKNSSIDLAQKSDKDRQFTLTSMAAALEENAETIVKANIEDLRIAKELGISKPLLSRLNLDLIKLSKAIEGLRQVAFLPDPIGIKQLHRELSQNLSLERITVPLGVLGIIFESRPDAVIQIASLAIRSGNAAILKGGSEASNTNKAIVNAIHLGMAKTDINPDSICLLTTRQESMGLLKLDSLVDLIIPRGSNELVRFIQDNTRIPVLGHADGVCHLYIDKDADLAKAITISVDSKCQYPAACNAVETLLIHQEIASEFLREALPVFKEKGVRVLGDKASFDFGVNELATDKDWATEYLDLILAVKTVSNIDEALMHIRKYGSRHTDGIITENSDMATKFFACVDSSGVYHNCSTRFADGFRYGFGAEVGISTQTLPPRGPVGLEGLVTYRYFLRGTGHIASDFASGKKLFTHKDIDK